MHRPCRHGLCGALGVASYASLTNVPVGSIPISTTTTGSCWWIPTATCSGSRTPSRCRSTIPTSAASCPTMGAGLVGDRQVANQRLLSEHLRVCVSTVGGSGAESLQADVMPTRDRGPLAFACHRGSGFRRRRPRLACRSGQASAAGLVVCMSSRISSSRCSKMAIRWIVCRSSRTLPGQE